MTEIAMERPIVRKDVLREKKERREERMRRRIEETPVARSFADGYVDYGLIFIVFFLAVFGLVMLYSTSSYQANIDFGDPAFYFRKQLYATGLGLVTMIVFALLPDYRFYRHVALPLYGGAIALVAAVHWFGYEANNAKRWIRIGGFSVQPAEVAKLAMIIFLAALICKMQKKVFGARGFLFFLGTALPVCLLIYTVTDNLSSAIIVFGIACVMLFVASPHYKRFVLLTAAGGAAVFGIVYYILHYADPSSSYRFLRVLIWRNPEAYATGRGYQTLQALYAIGSGGIFGKGLGESMQKQFVPEAQNDMIFSIICEELGLFGGIAVLLLFVLLLWRLMIIAQNAPDLFGSLLVVGVMAHIAIQVILNIAVVTNTIPNTGITLPFISYGGSAVLLQLAEMGIVMNVARHIGRDTQA